MYSPGSIRFHLLISIPREVLEVAINHEVKLPLPPSILDIESNGFGARESKATKIVASDPLLDVCQCAHTAFLVARSIASRSPSNALRGVVAALTYRA